MLLWNVRLRFCYRSNTLILFVDCTHRIGEAETCRYDDATEVG